MKKIKNILLTILVSVLLIPSLTYADSGFDASYDGSSTSVTEVGMNLGGSGLSFVSKLIKSQPKDKDYKGCHITTAIICIILFYVFTNVFVFKIKKPKSRKQKLVILGITLIPTIIFSLVCFLTKLQLVLYFFLAGIYILIFKIITSIIDKKRLKKNLIIAKKIDSNFDVVDFNNKAFNVYKDVQEAWMNFDLKTLKKLLSKDLYEKYEELLSDLKEKGQKNIMDNIEFKSNKIKDIDIIDNDLIIECEMTVTCFDYLINSEEKVIKGKKDKKLKYTYKLIYSKNIKKNNYILTKKRISKQS